MTTSTASKKRWASLPLVALVAAGGAWLLLNTNDETSPDAHAPEVTSTSLGQWGSTPILHDSDQDDLEEAQAAAAEALAEIEGTGRTQSIVDQQAEDVRDAQAYRQRINDNISHLELQAEIARQQGHPQRAELMEKRVSGLERRLSELEADS